MNRKLLGLLIVLIFSLCCVGIAFAENSTGDDVENDTEDIEEIDLSNYILATSINNGKIEFNDGYTGFSLDSSKEKITSNDPFSLGGFSNTKTENYVKLAIIEAYKQGRESNIASIVSKIVGGNLDTSDSVIKAVVESSDNIGSSAVANIDNTTEATFTFELLKSASDDKSDCLAYRVSMRTIEAPDIIASTDDGQDDSNDDKTSSADKDKKSQDSKKTDENKQGVDADTKDKQSEDNTTTNDTKQSEDKKAAGDNSSDKKESSEPKKANSTTVNETNTTIVKNTTTVIENNTTIIHNNVKEVNNTTAPKNDTISNLLKAGNPILILIIVIVVAVVAVVVLRRKG